MADEVRLIDANALKEDFMNDYNNYMMESLRGNHCDVIRISNVIERIEDAPTIESETVKHGRWETWGYIFHGIAWKRCSVCGKTADVSYQALLDGKIEMATPSICGCCSARLESDNE